MILFFSNIWWNVVSNRPWLTSWFFSFFAGSNFQGAYHYAFLTDHNSTRMMCSKSQFYKNEESQSPCIWQRGGKCALWAVNLGKIQMRKERRWIKSWLWCAKGVKSSDLERLGWYVSCLGNFKVVFSRFHDFKLFSWFGYSFLNTPKRGSNSSQLVEDLSHLAF